MCTDLTRTEKNVFGSYLILGFTNISTFRHGVTIQDIESYL